VVLLTAIGTAFGGASVAQARPATTAAAPCPPPSGPSPNPIGPAGNITEDQPLVSWDPVPGIDEYVVVILLASPDAQYAVTPNQQPFHIEGATSFRPPPLPRNTPMRWKVKTEFGTECYGLYSPSTYFTVTGSAPCPPAAAPTPFEPFGSINDQRPVFTWSAVPGAESYTLYVLRVSDDFQYVRATNITGTSLRSPVVLPKGVPLRWKVKGESHCGPGPYSPSTQFTIF